MFIRAERINHLCIQNEKGIAKEGHEKGTKSCTENPHGLNAFLSTSHLHRRHSHQDCQNEIVKLNHEAE